jgi:acyl-CoA synthetase (AMP-forming)/AMP-acid ligase II
MPTYPCLTQVVHCQARIAGYKCPRSIDFRDALPASAAGKVLKTRLRADYAKQEAPQ